MSKDSGNYEELIKRLEGTKDVKFEVKWLYKNINLNNLLNLKYKILNLF